MDIHEIIKASIMIMLKTPMNLLYVIHTNGEPDLYA